MRKKNNINKLSVILLTACVALSGCGTFSKSSEPEEQADSVISVDEINIQTVESDSITEVKTIDIKDYAGSWSWVAGGDSDMCAALYLDESDESTLTGEISFYRLFSDDVTIEKSGEEYVITSENRGFEGTAEFGEETITLHFEHTENCPDEDMLSMLGTDTLLFTRIDKESDDSGSFAERQAESSPWYGVYYYDDGDQGLYFFVDSKTENTVSGVRIYGLASGGYDCGRFTWNVDNADSDVASELFQNQMDYIYYRLTDKEIVVDYPDGWWPDRTFTYVCNLEQAKDSVNHPCRDEALALLVQQDSQKKDSANNHKEESQAPFYGIWVLGAKTEGECDGVVADLKSKGYAAKVYLTTDWENLNTEPWYVVSAGEYATEDEAQAQLGGVQAAGYSDAYVKYTGGHKIN